MAEIEEAEFVRLAEVAYRAGVQENTAERYLLMGVFVRDSTIKHGRSIQPIFRRSRISLHVEKIKEYKNRLKENGNP